MTKHFDMTCVVPVHDVQEVIEKPLAEYGLNLIIRYRSADNFREVTTGSRPSSTVCFNL